MSSEPRPSALGLKVANIVSYFLFTSSNVYSALGGHARHTGGPSETYLTPAAWLFSVWYVINMLFLGLLFYQFTERGGLVVAKTLGWRFPALFVLNAACNTLYAVEGSRAAYIAAFVVLWLVAGIVSHLYGTLRMEPEPETWAQTLFVHLPISLYHGFVVVIFFVAAFAAAGVDADTHPAGAFTMVFVFATLFFLESTAAGYVFYGNGDLAGASVISLGLLAIAQHQQKSRFVHWSALVFFVISTMAVIRAAVAVSHTRRVDQLVGATDEETAPFAPPQ
ncbi:hypothetical protein MSPP1_002347 [Malassezia sp. CBS 17886]|nr:hypothetical protein MSPP1_002347 [Malassezia sp. CBS 17886]